MKYRIIKTTESHTGKSTYTPQKLKTFLFWSRWKNLKEFSYQVLCNIEVSFKTENGAQEYIEKTIQTISSEIIEYKSK